MFGAFFWPRRRFLVILRIELAATEALIRLSD